LKVLVIHYSQSGQLTSILDRLLLPINNVAEVVHFKIEMENEFPFPWSKEAFFNCFPESFLQIPQPIKNIDDQKLKEKYDLIILGYQVWYLSPSIPINSFLKSEVCNNLFKNTSIVTITGARNMWIMAQEKVKKLIKIADGKLVGHIAFVDKHINHISVITIVQWMFSGKKEKYLGVFPKPGVSDKDIQNANVFGKVIAKNLQKDDYQGLQDEIIKLNGVLVKPFLTESDKKANKMFKIWANLIIKKPNKRKKLLKLFYLYLNFAIWILFPIVNFIHLILYPFRFKIIQRNIQNIQNIT
jgi:hypothetical protein